MSVFSRRIEKCVRLCFYGLFAAFLAGSGAGCSESNPLSSATLYPVKGKVLLADGKPLTSGQVIFVSSQTTVTSTAKLQSDGTFELKDGSGNGLPEGPYKVKIEAGSSTLGKGTGRSRGGLPFDSQFLDEDVSGLTATVTKEEASNNFEFKLVPKKVETGKSNRRSD
jgi:hypothetical protein